MKNFTTISKDDQLLFLEEVFEKLSWGKPKFLVGREMLELMENEWIPFKPKKTPPLMQDGKPYHAISKKSVSKKRRCYFGTGAV